MEKLLIGALLLAGIINLLPVVGLAGPERLAALYGLRFDDASLAILMRHRAVLFGLVGGFMVLSAFKPVLRPYGIAAGLVSMLSFVWLAIAAGDYNAQIRKVVVVDVAAAAVLLLAAILYYWRRA